MEPAMVTEQVKNIQEIQCIGKDTGFSFPINGNEVVVNASKIDSMEPNTASNKVKVSQIAKVEWEERYYYGNLVSSNSTFVAYIIKGKGDKEDHVRVINHQTSTRLLLRGPKKKVVDICFESFDSNQLACIDSEGTLHVYRIIEKDGIIKSNLIIKIYRQNVSDEEKQHVTWAPMLTMNTHESMIALSNGKNAEVYDLKRILEIFKLDGESNEDDSNITALKREFNRDDIMEGVKILKDCHSKTITCLALSPDTKVLVTCSEDGDVKFWSIMFDDSSPSSCLHEWEPHGGEPVTSLKFCDNLLANDDTVSFWRYLITGTNMSSTLKIWCAVEWECLQTIEFAPYTDQIPTSSPCMKIGLDISAKFLIVADIHRPVLYICHLSQDFEKEKTSLVSVSEFILKEPLLSFSIFTAKDRKGFLKSDEDMMNGDADGEDSGDTDEGDEAKVITSVILFAIQKNAIQKLSIKYSANLSPDVLCPSLSTAASSQEDLTSLRDGLSDIESSEFYSEKPIMHESVDPNRVNESVDSSITAVSTVTINGNHDDDEDVDCEEDAEVSAINKMNDNATTYNSITTSITDSFADTILSVNESKDITVGESVVNGLDSLSLDVSIPPIPVSVLETQQQNVLNEPSKSVDRCSSAPCDEREAITPPDSSIQGQIKKPVLTANPTTEQLITLLNNQQQVLNNQQQVLINQQQELKEVKDMLKQLLNKQHESVRYSSETAEKDQEDLKVYMQLLQKSTTSQLNKANKEFSKLCTAEKLDQFLSSMNSVVQNKQEQNLSSLQGIVSNTISIKLDKTIKQEMKQTVTASLEKLHSKYMDSINNQIAQKLSIWERTFREDSKELMKSPALVEAIGGSAANILQGTINNSYSECFTRIILPGFDKALVTVFQQVDKTFRQGTSEYLENVSKHLDVKRQKQQESRDPILNHLQELVQSFQATADRLTSGVETNLEALMQKQLRDSMDKMQNNFCKTVENRIAPSLSESISLSVAEAMEDFKKKLGELLAEGLYQTPNYQQVSPEQASKDRKERITQMVQEGHLNQAFEEALTASDLSLVMFLCRQVEPNGLFQAIDNPIPQPIILSLIQQLSVNLLEETERKRRYLEESIMALNKDDEITHEHLPAVLDALNIQLSSTIDTMIRTDSMNEQLKPLKMLLMASKSLLHGA